MHDISGMFLLTKKREIFYSTPIDRSISQFIRNSADVDFFRLPYHAILFHPILNSADARFSELMVFGFKGSSYETLF